MSARITVVMAAVTALLLLPLLGRAEERLNEEEHPHGLPYESPLALSPAAYDFFHPSVRRERARQAHGAAPALAPRGASQQLRDSVAKGAVARADHEEGGVAPVNTARHGAFRVGKLSVVLAAAAAVALVAVGVAYAVARRRLARRGGTGTEAGAPKSNA